LLGCEVVGEILLRELAGTRRDEVLEVELFETPVVLIGQPCALVDSRGFAARRFGEAHNFEGILQVAIARNDASSVAFGEASPSISSGRTS
jgi:hypothetical protein